MATNILDDLLQGLLGGMSTEGQDTLLGTLNERNMGTESARTSSGTITPMVDEQLMAQMFAQAEPQAGPSIDNNFFIQEQAVSQADLDRMLQQDWVKKAEQFRANGGKESNDGWQEVAKGTYKKFGVLDKEGKSFGNQYTNVKDASGTPTMMPPMDPVATPENALLGSNISARLDAIRRAPDARSKVEMFQQLQVDAAGEEARILETIQNQANLQADVKGFEARVAFNSAKDRAHPQWQVYKTDSKETAQARQELDKARLRAQAEAQRMAGTNIRLTTLKTQIHAMKPLLDLDLKAEERKNLQEDRQAFTKEQADANAQARKDEKTAMQEAKTADAKELILSQTTPQKRARLSYLDPTAIGKSDDELATMLVKSWTKLSAQDKEAINAQPENLLPMALAGNASATRVLVEEEAGRTGKAREEVGRELAAIKTLSKDQRAIDDTARQLLSGDPESFNRYKSLKLAATTMGAKKEDVAAFEQAKQSLVTQRIQGAAQSKWLGDLSSWKLTDPVVKAAYDQAAQAGGSKDLITIARIAVDKAPAGEKARLMDAFAKEIRGNADMGKSLLGQPNPDVAINMVQAELTKSRWGAVAPEVSKFLNTSPVPLVNAATSIVSQEANAAYEWLFGDRK